MQPFDYVVANMMARFGGAATLEVVTIGEYDTTISETVNTVVQYPVKFLLFDYTQKNMGDKSDSGTLILGGDKQCFVQPINKNNPYKVMPLVQPNKDSIIINNVRWKILSIKDVNPSGVDSVLYEYHLRK